MSISYNNSKNDAYAFKVLSSMLGETFFFVILFPPFFHTYICVYIYIHVCIYIYIIFSFFLLLLFSPPFYMPCYLRVYFYCVCRSKCL